MLSKKLTGKLNKFFNNNILYYIVLVLAITTILGFLFLQNWNAIIFFILTSFITSFLTDNVTIILIVGIILSNLILLKSKKEGMESSSSGTDTTDSTGSTNSTDVISTTTKKPIAKAAVVSNIKSKTTTDSSSDDITTPLTSSTTSDTTGDVDTTETMQDMNVVSVHKDTNKKKRIDYGSTLEAAYDNLETMLDSDGLGKLTDDTKKLMDQQQKLFKSIESMAPMVNDAKKMLEGFDMGNLNNLTNLLQTSKKN